MRNVRAGGLCWVLLAAIVLCMDYWLIRNGHDTMSIVFGDALVHPVRRFYVTAAWAVITAHLFSKLLDGHIPDSMSRFDPIGIAARQVKPKGKYEEKFIEAWNLTVEAIADGALIDTD